MKKISAIKWLLFCLFIVKTTALCAQSSALPDSMHDAILTPISSEKPRINGATIFGVRPGAPFIYSIPATGKKPMVFSARGLPKELKLDAATGRITGSLQKVATYNVIFQAKNQLGSAIRSFKIVVGTQLALTPPMGWNSWNCWGSVVTQEKVMQSAKALIKYKLNEHGWTYINIDDAWQGERGGSLNAIQPDPKKFPDMKALCDSIHGLGLKVGIYSTPWTKSYAGRIGGSAQNPEGLKDSSFINHSSKRNLHVLPYDIGKYSFAKQDAQQWALWGIDYLKYDWAPVDAAATKEMYQAIAATNRDIILSLSNNASQSLFQNIAEVYPFAQCWRTTNDINDSWGNVSKIGFSQDKWAAYTQPGHFNDPDMLVVGRVGWGKPHPTRLTVNEQYAHMSLWCLLAAPLLIGCDLDKLDDFTLSLLTNDEVIDIDQDLLCKQAIKVGGNDTAVVYAKPLSDGSLAVGLFNKGAALCKVGASWNDLKINGKQTVRNVWKQQDIGVFDEVFEVEVPSHGVVLVKISTVKLLK